MSIRSFIYTEEPTPWLITAPIVGGVGSLVVLYRPHNNDKVKARFINANDVWNQGKLLCIQFGLYVYMISNDAFLITDANHAASIHCYKNTSDHNSTLVILEGNNMPAHNTSRVKHPLLPLSISITVPLVSAILATLTFFGIRYFRKINQPSKKQVTFKKTLSVPAKGSTASAALATFGPSNARLICNLPIFIGNSSMMVVSGITVFALPQISKVAELYGDAFFEMIGTVSRAAFVLNNIDEFVAVFDDGHIGNLPIGLGVTLIAVYIAPAWYEIGRNYRDQIRSLRQVDENEPLLERAHDTRDITWQPPICLVKRFGIFSRSAPENNAAPQEKIAILSEDEYDVADNGLDQNITNQDSDVIVNDDDVAVDFSPDPDPQP